MSQLDYSVGKSSAIISANAQIGVVVQALTRTAPIMRIPYRMASHGCGQMGGQDGHVRRSRVSEPANESGRG